jgi:hypothetical protein
MDSNSLAQQLAGRSFGEFVLLQLESKDLPAIVVDMQEAKEELPKYIRLHVESWIDEVKPLGNDPSFWQKDCGDTFFKICDKARRKFNNNTVEITDENLTSMFYIIVLNFAYNAHKDADFKKFIHNSTQKEYPAYAHYQYKEVPTQTTDAGRKKTKKSLWSWKSLFMAIGISILLTGIIAGATGQETPNNMVWTIAWIYLTIEAWKYWKWKALLPYFIYCLAMAIASAIVIPIIAVAYPNNIFMISIVTIYGLNIGGLVVFYRYLSTARDEAEHGAYDEGEIIVYR